MESRVPEALAQAANGGRREQFLSFYLESELYGVEIFSVKEIIAYMKTTKIPKAPAHLKGVMNLRGNIIPVMDMRTKFNLPPRQPDMHTAIIIVALKGVNVGFVVDQVEEVVSLEESAISEPPRFGAKVDTQFLRGMGQFDKQVIMILDLGTMLSHADLENIEGVQRDA